MRILYYGPKDGNSYSRFRGIQLLGHEVESVFEKDPIRSSGRIIRGIESRLHNGPVTMKLNKVFLQRAKEFKPDLLWVEKGKSIYAKTLKQVKEQLGCLMVNSYSDYFLYKHSRHYTKSISLYDHIFTPRDANFSEYYQYGAKAVSKFWKGFDQETLFPVELTPEDRANYETDVTFIGHCEPNRIKGLSALAKTVENMKVWGPGWGRHILPARLKKKVQFRSVWNEEYRKALCGAKIVVNYLSIWNRDTQSSKSFEIPACAAFMLSERTQDLLALFQEDKEAVFFSSSDELIEKVHFYLRHDDLRKQIAQAGYQRCLTSGYSNYDRIKSMLDVVLESRKQLGNS
jgi:spore maturation protein CgeB